MRALVLALLVVLVVPISVAAARLHPEDWYQDKFCSSVGGTREHVLADLTRIDCLTDRGAYELGFSSSKEDIFQALHYGRMTGKRPGYVIIVEDPTKELKYLQRIMNHLLDLDRPDLEVIIITPGMYE